MASRHTKITFPSKLVNLFHSKNSLFYLFVFLICLPIGFICSFYLQSFSAAIQTSIFSVFRSLSLVSPPPLPLPHADTLSSLTPPPSLVSPPPLSSNLPQPPLPLPDNLSLSPPPPLTSNLPQPSLPLPLDNLSLSPPPLPPLTSNLPQPPPPLSLPLPLPDNLSLSPPLPPLTSNLREPPLPLPDDLSLSPPPLAPLSSESIPSAISPSSLPFKVSITEQMPMMHNMSDDELVKRVMEIPKMTTTNTPYKVAFMFLTPGPLPLSPLWELFFKGHKGLFSIYVHPHPSYNDTIPQDSVFYATRITSQVA
ncbi:putative glycosyl transferase, family 14 [Helianthus annuus]|nr:putative glycosyl transferase, family 14 [Helianthus annuus]